MTIEDIYSTISKHMVKGLMVHEQFANYYDFLGLEGYSKCHEYHYIEELLGHRKLNNYYITHYNKLIPYRRVEDPKIIPESWFNHERKDVDVASKENAIQMGLIKWIDWEKSTKSLYESMYRELIELGDIAGALEISEYIKDVSQEIVDAEQYFLNKEAIRYDLSEIISEQKYKAEHFSDLICKLI